MRTRNAVHSRRELLAGLATLGLLAAYTSACSDTTGPPSTTAPRLNDAIEGIEDRYDVTIGVWAVDLVRSLLFEHRSDEQLPMCSTFKTYAAARILQLRDTGTTELDTMIPIRVDDIVVDSEITAASIGSQMSLRDICAAALVHSDNTAGNLMLEVIGGPEAVTRFARTVGDTQSRLDRWEPTLNSAVPADPRDTTTARALCQGYREILTGDALSPNSRRQLLEWMTATATSNKRIRAGLPSGWSSADKTGAGYYGTNNDIGLLTGPFGQQIILGVLTRSRRDDPDAQPSHDAIAETVRQVVGALGR